MIAHPWAGVDGVYLRGIPRKDLEARSRLHSHRHDGGYFHAGRTAGARILFGQGITKIYNRVVEDADIMAKNRMV